jgi:hypothetical protein
MGRSGGPERDRFLKRNNGNGGKQNNDHRSDNKSQWDYSGSNRKRKLEDTIAAVDRTP